MTLPTYPADQTRTRRVRYTVATTSPAPSVPATDETQQLDLISITAIRIGLQADPGTTLTGTGTLRAHYLDSSEGSGRWGQSPDLDVAIPTAAAGRDVYWLPDVQVWVPMGRLHLQADGIGLSGPGNVTIHLIGWRGA